MTSANVQKKINYQYRPESKISQCIIVKKCEGPQKNALQIPG
jgi:hypothetical protein